MSSDRKRTIGKAPVSRSQDRWRPPDQKRGRRPAGTEAANLEKTGDNNSNASSFRRKQPSLQARRWAEQRRIRRLSCAQRVWRLGDRVLFGLVDHLACRFGLEDEIDRLLDRFAALDPAVLRALGGDRLPAPPIHRVGGVG